MGTTNILRARTFILMGVTVVATVVINMNTIFRFYTILDVTDMQLLCINIHNGLIVLFNCEASVISEEK